VSAPTFDKEPPVLPVNLKPGRVLIFSKTNGFRDDGSIQASNAALAAIAHERGWPFFITENGAVMNKEQLERFKVVVWNNTSGDTLTPDQRALSRVGWKTADPLWALTAPAAIPSTAVRAALRQRIGSGTWIL
jgi:hypothetical protein